MSHYPRKIMPPGGCSRKRKEREDLPHSLSLKPKAARPSCPAAGSSLTDGMISNWVLAGYMAYEFLNKGTLLGKKFDPATTTSAWGSEQRDKKEEHHRYAEVSRILKTDGTHIAGIVNPTQLTRWTQL